MTSRPSAGIQRTPQRSLSGTGMIQRPAPTRALSQQFQTSSPPIRKPDSYVDLSLEGSASVLGLHGQNSRIAGSRLKLELTKDMAKPTLDSPKAEVWPAELQPVVPNRGRPIVHFDPEYQQLQNAAEGSLVVSLQGGENITAQTPLPMPKRPGQRANFPNEISKASSRTAAVKKDARPKPYVLETPSIAPHYPSNGHADFFPWTGNHPEDQFTDNVIRQGYFDKAQPTQNETGSAKNSLLPAFKHKANLQTLSSLFTSILSQRRAHGQITSNPTFKPPPRVTLTDTKKETWLRDLANPDIPLRRLSRTIPHGIRGKILLEQCLSKKIPSGRAVWLVKCVGANEIRAFKRKGVNGNLAIGGEAKWIRDWTIFVEQFIEGIIVSCGEADWKEKFNYVIGLAVHLFSEHLLDTEHYLDWVSTSLEHTAIEKMPLWLLVTQVFYRHLMKARKFGRRMVGSLCAHLQMLHDMPDCDIFLPLIETIVHLLKCLLDTYPESFVAPKIWRKHQKMLQQHLSPDPLDPSLAFLSVYERNDRLDYTHDKPIEAFGSAFTKLLDQSLSKPYSPSIARECWSLSDNKSLLVWTIIKWASSPHRPGTAKTYVGARILRAWCKSMAVDLNHELLSFLGLESNDSVVDRADFYHLVSELSRSNHFSISAYVQWLIARGGIRERRDLAEDGPLSTRLLAELSTHEVSESIMTLRQTLLRRAHIDVNQEEQEIEVCMDNILALLSDPEQNHPVDNPDQSGLTVYPVIKIGLTRASKSELGVRLRNVASSMVEPLNESPKLAEVDASDTDTFSITLEKFHLFRKALEDIQDISMLADVVSITCGSESARVLAAICNTLGLHLHSFAGIGALELIFEKLLARVNILLGIGDVEVVALLESLITLAARLPGKEVIVSQLSQALTLSTRKTAADACSPVSDYVTEVLQNTEPEFSDEIEKALASGTSMDQQTLGRFFLVIVERMEMTWHKPSQEQHKCALLLLQLRTFDARQFSSLVSAWLRQIMEKTRRPNLVLAIGPLIATGCIQLRDALNLSAEILASGEVAETSRLALEALGFLLGSRNEESFLTVDDAYSLATKRMEYQKGLPAEALTVLRRTIDVCVSTPRVDHGDFLALIRSQPLQNFLTSLLLIDIESVTRLLFQPLVERFDAGITSILDELSRRLLYPGRPEIWDTSRSKADRIEIALRSANHLTLPFCKLELRMILGIETSGAKDDENQISDCREAFERAIDYAVTNQDKTWTSIIRTVDPRIPRDLCRRAETLFLDLAPLNSANEFIALPPERLEEARRHLFVVQATAVSLESTTAEQLASRIMDMTHDIMNITWADEEGRITVNAWLPLLLDLITIHMSHLDISKTSSSIRARIACSLVWLMVRLSRHNLPDRSLLIRIFDTALVLVDEISESASAVGARLLKEKTADKRAQYVFNYGTAPMEWLQLSQKGKVVPYPLRRWEVLSEPTPVVGENDTSISLTLFQARKL